MTLKVQIHYWKVSLAMSFVGALSLVAFASPFEHPVPADGLSLNLFEHRLDLTDPAHIKLSLNTLDQWLNEIQAAKKMASDSKDELLRNRTLETMPFQDLNDYFATHSCDGLSSKMKSGVKVLEKLTQEILAAGSENKRIEIFDRIREVAQSMTNICEPAIAKRVDLVELPYVAYQYAHFPIGKGQVRASNLDMPLQPTDLSQADPQPSTFWHRPQHIARSDLFLGYGRSKIPNYDFKTCTYFNPKTNIGTNAGFEVLCGDDVIKVKLGESFSEPVVSRIFWALGYNVSRSDFANEVQLPYSRRVLREFNMRQKIATDVTVLKTVDIAKLQITPVFDPFNFIRFALLQDGTRVDGTQLKQFLFKRSGIKHPELNPDNFKLEQEKQIKFLVFRNANIQAKDNDDKSVGSWSYNSDDHANLRELRGMGLLAAWLGYYDVRTANTHLLIDRENPEDLKLIHQISDLGAGLTGIPPLFGSARVEKVNKFAWKFTELSTSDDKLKFVNFITDNLVLPFKNMTMDDARWMARLISQLSLQQIESALIGGGLSSAEVKLYTAKLLSRRNAMLSDVGLKGLAEDSLSSSPTQLNYDPRALNYDPRALNYDPRVDGPIQIRTSSGKILSAPIGTNRIEKGVLVGPYTHD